MTIKDKSQLSSYLSQLKGAGVAGVMSGAKHYYFFHILINVDCWWGLVEQQEKQYNFAPYAELTQLVADAGLKIEFVLSFHRCGISMT